MTRSRLRLLEPEEWPAEMRARAEGPLGALNVMKALMHHPDLFRRWSVFANHFLFKSALPDRAREILILRTALLTGSTYEWFQHVRMSREACGFGPTEFAAIQAGAQSSLWSDAERGLLRLTDNLVAGPTVPDRVWDQMADHWDERQSIDAIALVGNYVMLAMALNSIGVPPETADATVDLPLPDKPRAAPHKLSPGVAQPSARIQPLEAHHAGPELGALLEKARGDYPTVNVIDTLARHPDLLRRWMPFFNHCLHKQSLDERQREIVILRTAWTSGSGYEWSQHVPIARKRGLTRREIEEISLDPSETHYQGTERALIDAVDALMTRFTLDDTEWRKLAMHVSPPRVLDTIFTVGQYRLVAGLLDGLRVQLDGYLRFPPPLD